MMATAAPSTALPSQGIWASSLISDLHRRAVPVLVYSMHTDPWRVGSAFEAGALGYVTKRAFHTMLVQGIRDVAAGCTGTDKPAAWRRLCAHLRF